MSKQDKIAEIVKRVSNKKAAPGVDESLFESGYLDSFALTETRPTGKNQLWGSLSRLPPGFCPAHVGRIDNLRADWQSA